MVKLVVTDRVGTTHEIDAEQGKPMMQSLRDMDNSVDAICGGMRMCATCHVFIDQAYVGLLPERVGEELALLEYLPSFNPETSRLSCQIELNETHEGMTLTIGPAE